MLRLAIILATGCALFSPLFAAPKKSKPAVEGDTAPELVSTEGGGPRWKNLKELRAHAEKGDARAGFELGERLLLGNGVEANPAEGRAWLEKAARAGEAAALFRLGKMHADGLGVPEDPARAHECFLAAARGGVPEAMHNVGAALVSGRGVKRDYTEGLAWLIVATKSGADSDSEQRTRAHLAKRPAVIAAAEKRAQEIQESLRVPAANVSLTEPKKNPPGATTTLPAPQKVKIDLGDGAKPPKPKIILPKPNDE
jgi:hypothetical protein